MKLQTLCIVLVCLLCNSAFADTRTKCKQEALKNFQDCVLTTETCKSILRNKLLSCDVAFEEINRLTEYKPVHATDPDRLLRTSEQNFLLRIQHPETDITDYDYMVHKRRLSVGLGIAAAVLSIAAVPTMTAAFESNRDTQVGLMVLGSAFSAGSLALSVSSIINAAIYRRQIDQTVLNYYRKRR